MGNINVQNFKNTELGSRTFSAIYFPSCPPGSSRAAPQPGAFLKEPMAQQALTLPNLIQSPSSWLPGSPHCTLSPPLAGWPGVCLLRLVPLWAVCPSKNSVLPGVKVHSCFLLRPKDHFPRILHLTLHQLRPLPCYKLTRLFLFLALLSTIIDS